MSDIDVCSGCNRSFGIGSWRQMVDTCSTRPCAMDTVSETEATETRQLLNAALVDNDGLQERVTELLHEVMVLGDGREATIRECAALFPQIGPDDWVREIILKLLEPKA